MHLHGAFYPPAYGGAEIASDPGCGGAIKPGRSYTYEWRVRPDSVGTWPYHDHAMAMPLPGVHSEGGMMVGPQMELEAELACSGCSPSPGKWLYHWHVVDHMMGGMIGHYVVS